MEVVPVHAEVQIEHVPANSLARMRYDGRGVADKRAAVVAKGGQTVAATFDDAVLARAVVDPGDLPTDPNRYIRRAEREIDDGDRGSARASGLNRDRASHRRTVDPADVIVSSADCEDRRDIGAASVERRA